MLTRGIFSLAFVLACYSLPVVAAENDTPNIIASKSYTYNADIAPPLGLPESTERRGIGPVDTPVKAVLFFDIECNTCVAYWKTMRPKLLALAAKKKLRIYFQETYGTKSGWGPSLYLRCSLETEYMNLVERVLSDRAQWIDGGDTQTTYLKNLTMSTHQDWQKIQACMSDKEQRRKLSKDHDQFFIYYGITQVPVIQVLNSPYRFGGRMDAAMVETMLLSLAEPQIAGH